MHLFTFSAVAVLGLSAVWACAPVAETEVSTTTSASTAATSPTAGRKKRSIESIEIEIVTTKKYDQNTVASNLKLVKDVIDNYQKKQGIQIDFSNIESAIENKNGKFAVTYYANDQCRRVKNFVKGAKASSNDVAYAIIKCGGNTPDVL